MTRRSISDDRKQPFVWLHLEFDDLPLDPYAVRVYIHILRRAGRGNDGKCWESVEHIAKHCGMSVSSVKRALRTLIEAGLIVRVSRSGDTSLYSITDPEEWIIQPQVITEPALKQPGSSQSQGVALTEPGGGPEMAHKERSLEERSLEERSLSLESKSSHSNNSTSQPELSEPVAPTIEKFEALSSQKPKEPKPTVEDNYSAAANFPQQKEIHPCQQFEERMRGEKLAWDEDEDFLQWLSRRMSGEEVATKLSMAQRMITKSRHDWKSREAVGDYWKIYQKEQERKANPASSYASPAQSLPPVNFEGWRKWKEENGYTA